MRSRASATAKSSNRRGRYSVAVAGAAEVALITVEATLLLCPLVGYDSGMPIHPAMKHHYAADWRRISASVRFGRAAGRCETCARPHRTLIYALADGRWLDPQHQTWRNTRAEPSSVPDPVDLATLRSVRVVISTAHLDHDSANRDPANLRALCQRCHLQHDLAHHLRQRWITCRRRYAIGDLFWGMYPTHPIPLSAEPAYDLYGLTDDAALQSRLSAGLSDGCLAEVDGLEIASLLQPDLALSGQFQAGDKAAGPRRASP